MSEPLLRVRGLQTTFASRRRPPVPAVRGVSFELARGETLGLVGESGSGKSVTALSILRLLPSAGRVVGGSVELDGQDLLQLPPGRAMRAIRGGRIAIVFQDAMTSLNPLLTVGRQIGEGLAAHRRLHGRQARERSCELLLEVGISEPERRLRQYPHQLSGGLRQRVAVAIALTGDPDLLIADEPTTALDVTIQAQILELLAREQQRRGMALLLITHDLGVVAGMTDRIIVMYAGRIVEEGPTREVFRDPQHPYTRGLLASAPRVAGDHGGRLPSIPGSPPSPAALPTGCPFRPRCPLAEDACAEAEPALEPVGAGRRAACIVAQRLVAR